MAAEGQTGSKMLDEMPEYRIFELLKKYHYTLTTAESATGGPQRLSMCRGSPHFLRRDMSPIQTKRR